VASAAATLLAAPALLVYIAEPTIITSLPPIALVLVLSAIGFGVLFASMIVIVLIDSAASERQQLLAEAARPEKPKPRIREDWDLLQRALLPDWTRHS